jgi:hypothetical protein
MMSDSILSDAGSVFFAAWFLTIAAIAVKAFGRDLLRSQVESASSGNQTPLDRTRPDLPATR